MADFKTIASAILIGGRSLAAKEAIAQDNVPSIEQIIEQAQGDNSIVYNNAMIIAQNLVNSKKYDPAIKYLNAAIKAIESEDGAKEASGNDTGFLAFSYMLKGDAHRKSKQYLRMQKKLKRQKMKKEMETMKQALETGDDTNLSGENTETTHKDTKQLEETVKSDKEQLNKQQKSLNNTTKQLETKKVELKDIDTKLSEMQKLFEKLDAKKKAKQTSN